MMSPEQRLGKIQDLYNSARERAPAERESFLAEACAGDSELLREVASLLREASSGQLDKPLMEAAASLLSNSSSWEPGAKVGPYQIVSRLGEGGMGVVYRALDTRLGRSVAIKTTSREFSGRFQQEARAIAALNHPNICTLHDVGPDYLVMELVDGKPLSCPQPLDSAIRYSIQITDALDAAHRRGITHRDLKPANILVTKSGVKLLDFGLAKFTQPQTDPDATQVMGETQPGMILGTPQYMSPEQVEAKEADARSDIFSFGAILYEMISGNKAFAGTTAATVMSAVMRETPPSIEPPALNRIIKRCLEKDPDNRFQNARDVKHALEDIQLPDSEPRRAGSSRKWKLATAALTVAATTFGIAYWRSTPATAPAYHLAITPPQGLDFDFGVDMGRTVISPDGRTLGFFSKNSIWLRSLDSPSARKLTATEGARNLFWSPDSKSIGFITDQGLKRTDLDTGSVKLLAKDCEARGASWSRSGVIAYVGRGLSLYQVQSTGGDPKPITKLDETLKENRNYWPFFLPDGDHFLYTSGSTNPGIYVGSLKDSMLKTRIVESASSSVFVAPLGRYPGYLLFARAGSLFAQPFNADRLSISGDAQVISPVGVQPSILAANFSASANGVIVLGLQGQSQAQFAWFDRGGKQLGAAFPSEYQTPRISPDGKFVTFRRLESIGRSSMLLLDLSRQAVSPIADDSGAIAWSSDSTEVIYRGNDSTFYRKKINSTGAGVPLFMGTSTVSHMDWSPDGKYLVANRGQFHSVDGKHPVPAPLEPSAGFRFSPDGKWLALHAQGKDGYEVLVQSFPDAAIRLQVSTAGGSYPSWRGDGNEIYFRSTNGMLTGLTVTPRDNTLLFGPPEPLFQIKGEMTTAPFTAAPDGRKFLVRVPLLNGTGSDEITVLTNWRAGLKQ